MFKVLPESYKYDDLFICKFPVLVLIVNAELLTPLFKKIRVENLLRKIFMIFKKLKEDLLFFSLEISFYNQLFSLNQQFQVL